MELGAHGAVPAGSAVAAVRQLLRHSGGSCHREVTGPGIPDRWPCAGDGGSAASVALLRKVVINVPACASSDTTTLKPSASANGC